jgi:ribonuclease HI
MAGEASVRGERVRELGIQARDRINTDFNVDNPDTPPRASQKLIATATLLRAVPAPSTPEVRNLHREAQALIEQAAVQQAESSASRIHQQGDAWGDGGAQGGKPSVHAGGAAERPANLGRTPAKERLLDTRRARDGNARNVINARRASKADARVAAGYHPRRGGRYDSDEDRSPTPEPPGTRVFSREIRAAAFPQRFCQPTTIVKYIGDTDPRVWLNDYRLACQLGGATSDEVIIRNLSLHLGDSARTWLEHLPTSQIHNWEDLVRTFQILLDFVAEWTDTQLPPPQIQAECWTLYFDSSVMKTGAGAGLLFVSPLGEHMRYAVRLHFPASNNMAEYEALLCGLKIAIEIGVKRLDVRGDSQLVIDQVMKNASCHMIRWKHTARPCDPSRTSSTASSSITCPAGTTRRRTSWQRSRLGGSLSPRTFFPEMSSSPPSPSSRTPRTTRNPRGLPRIQQT